MRYYVLGFYDDELGLQQKMWGGIEWRGNGGRSQNCPPSMKALE